MFSKWFHAKQSKKDAKQSEPKQDPSQSTAQIPASPSVEGPKEDAPVTQQHRVCTYCGAAYRFAIFTHCPRDGEPLSDSLTKDDVDQLPWAEQSAFRDIRYCPECGEFASTLDATECGADQQSLVAYEPRPGPVLLKRFQLVSFLFSNLPADMHQTSRVYRTDDDSSYRNTPMEVFLATDIESKSSVAVKKLHWEDEATVERFQTVAASVAGLKHDYLISVVEVGSQKGWKLIMVTDHPNAQPMSKWLETEKRLSEKTAIKVFLEISAALEFVHSHGIVHGALNLHNLHMERSSENFVGLLANFGVAERMFQNMQWQGVSTETNTVNVFGDPSGMCPEFCKALRPTALTDIYQLGSAMYQALSGHPPFRRRTWPMVMMAHLNEPPDPIEEVEVSEAFAAIIMTCLNKNPDDRFASAGALKDALQSI
ncbi:MAG: serine/threonine protein kinase [Candidatus Obscuribacterales bacterium]|nr:serine/threonine protein kinase [Candidatus Obscuribacterales bacterium]